MKNIGLAFKTILSVGSMALMFFGMIKLIIFIKNFTVV